MKQLKALKHDDYAAHVAVAASKSRTAPIVQERLAELRERFAEYRAVCDGDGVPAASRFSDPSTKAAFLRLYEKPPKCVETLKDRLRAIETKNCPYCCGMGIPTTLDHYLGKALFPEFSLAACNLVPACTECNKNEELVAGAISKIHPYFHAIAAKELIECAVKGNVRYPEISLRISPGKLTPQQLTLTRNHISWFNLESRFADSALGRLRRYSREFTHESTLADEAIHAQLTRSLASFKPFGANHWQAVLIRFLLADNSRLKYVTVRGRGSH